MKVRSAGLMPTNSSGRVSSPGDTSRPRDIAICARLISRRPSASSSKWVSNADSASVFSPPGSNGSVAPHTFSRSDGSMPRKNSVKPAMRSALVNTTYTGANTSNRSVISCTRWRRFLASSIANSGLLPDSSAMLAAMMMPLTGARGRFFFNRSRKVSHSSRSSTLTE